MDLPAFFRHLEETNYVQPGGVDVNPLASRWRAISWGQVGGEEGGSAPFLCLPISTPRPLAVMLAGGEWGGDRRLPYSTSGIPARLGEESNRRETARKAATALARAQSYCSRLFGS